jgi:predicted dehydrogenase
MKFLIAGLGSIGRRHLRNLLALGETDILLFRTHRSTLPDDELEPFPTFTDLTQALAQKPEAVIVANPTALHLDVAIPAGLAGCSLLIEKPVSHTLENISELEHAVALGGRQVLVGFQFRYHPGLQKVKQLLDEGVMGNPIYVRVHWGEYLPGWHPWEDYRLGYAARADLGGGVVRTLCHPFDYLRWLLGEVAAINAFLGSKGGLELDVEDTADIQLQFKSGVIGNVHLNYIQRPPVHNLEIVATCGTIRWDNSSGRVSVYHAGADSVWEEFPPPAGFERNWLFIDQMKHFLEVVQGLSNPRCNLMDGIQAMRITAAVYESHKVSSMVRL